MEIYINKLIENIPNESYGEIDLIMDGGAFSGSYILGALHYLKIMEKNKKLKIDKLSGTSIGSILCILYKLNDLEYASKVYKYIRTYYKTNGNLFVLSNVMKNIRTNLMKRDFYKKCNNKVYITYYDIENNIHVVKNKYKNNKDLCDTVVRSSYIPWICGENIFYKNKYIDGLKPHIFNNKRTLFINLSMDYKLIHGFLNIKNEINNIERVMNGVLDIHSFFINKKSTNMCFYLDKMSYGQKILHTIRISVIYIVVSGFSMGHYFNRTFYSSKFDNIFKTFSLYIKPYIHNYLKLYLV
jgi:hypothetical protein